MDKETYKYAILGGIGWICICLGIYAVLTKGAVFHPIFENQHFINMLFIVGIYLTIIEIRFFVKKAIAISKAKRNQDDMLD
jgi:multisubunit Na+/H+ antiporter MnhB subunit